MTLPYIVSQSKTVTVYLDTVPHSVDPDHPFYARVVDCLKNGKDEELKALLENSIKLEGATIEDGQVFWGGKPLHNVLVDRILEQTKMGLGSEHMLKFLDNLMQNPSEASREELYDFLANEALPITEDGHFLAYKAVRDDFKDIYTGTVDNSVGAVVEMARSEVDDDRRHECSYGYHVGAIQYVRGYGHSDSRYLLVKVNPKDAVSVPLDHNAQKLRVCKYEVVAEVSHDTVLDYPVYSSDGGKEAEPLYTFNESHWDDDEDESDEEYLESLWADVDQEELELEEEKEEFRLERTNWYDHEWTRDEVVVEAKERGLTKTIEEGRSLGKAGVVAMLVEADLESFFG